MGTPRNLSKLAENTDSSGVLGIASGGTGGSTAAAAKSALNLHAVASSGSYADLNNKPTTANIPEDTNLYYTDARARAAVSATGSLSYNSTTGVFSYTTPSTSGIAEGTNLYFTDARVRAAVSAGTNLSYNSTTGVFSTTLTQYTDALARAAVSADTGLSYNSTTGVFSTTLTQYTDALARAAVSATGSLSYNSTTGVFSYTTPSTSGIAEGSNLYYTDARARAAHSAGTGISYNSTTGAISSTITQYTDALARAAVSAGTGLSYNSTTGVFTNSITQYTDALAVSANTSAIATAKSEAIASAATDATNKANAAQAAAIAAVTGGAGAAFDTLKEIQDAMATDAELAAAIASITVGNATQTIAAGTGLSGGGSFTANQTAASTVTLGLGTAGTSGTYTKVTTDAYGRVTSGTTLSSGDIPSLSGIYLPLAGGTMTGIINMAGTQIITTAGYAGIEYYNAAGNWEGYIGTENNAGNLRYNARLGTHTWYANSTSIGAWDASSLRVSGAVLTTTGASSWGVYSNTNGSNQSGIWFSTNVGELLLRKANGDLSTRIAADGSYAFINNNNILHAGNYNSYAPTLTGTGASGTWGISISGNSATTSQRSFSNDISTTGQGRFGGWYSGGAATGPATEVGFTSGEGYILTYNRNTSAYAPLNIAASGANMQFNGSTINVTSGSLQQGGNQVLHAGNYSSYALPLSGGTLSGVLTLVSSGTAINISGQSDSFGYNATAGLGTYIKGTGATYIYGGGKFFDGATAQTLLHAGNYTSYSPTLTGGGASGTWGINITGSANSASTAGKTSATTVPASTSFSKWLFATTSTGGTLNWNDQSNTIPGVGTTLLLGTADNGPGGGNYYHPFNIEYSSNDGGGQITQMAIAYATPANELFMRGRYASSWNGWTRFLNSSNYNSYALPLSGGTLSGDLRVNTIRDTAGGWVLGKNGTEVSLGSAGLVNEIRFNSSANAAFEYRGNAILHAGNYSSYALPISGGSLTGALSAVSGLRSYYSDHLAGDGYGIRFWESNAYKISMGASSLYQYGTVTEYSIKMQMDNGSPGRGFTWGRESFAPVAALNATTGSLQTAGAFKNGNNFARPTATWGSTGATGMVIFKLPGSSGNYGMVHMVFDIYEYNSNSVSTVIVGGHNWASSWYNTGANVIGQLGKQVRLGYKDGQYCVVFGDASSYWEYGTIVFRKIHNGDFYNNVMDLGAAVSVQFTATESFTNIGGDLRALRTPASFNAGGAITQAGNQVLHAGNYTSYAPSTTGTTSATFITAGNATWGGRLQIGGNGGASSLATVSVVQATDGNLHMDPGLGKATYLNYYNNGIIYLNGTTYQISANGANYNGTAANSSTLGGYGPNQTGGANTIVQRDGNGYIQNSYFYTSGGGSERNGSGLGYFAAYNSSDYYIRSYTPAAAAAAMGALTTGNYSSYALPLSGGTLSGDITFSNGRKAIVGVYDPTQTQAVFAMGPSYKLTDGGGSSNYGNFYGLGWSYDPNYGGSGNNPQSKAGLGHQLLLMMAGTTRTALGTGIWTDGNITATYNITAYSDERLKTNWRDMPENFVARLAQVRVGIYDRTDQEDTTQVGVSAQSFQELLPQAIMTAKDEMGTLSVSYGNAALASAVELAKEVVDLKTRVAQLEALINKLIKD